MPTLRIALVQADPTVGDIAGNSERVISLARHAANRGAQVVAFPEMFLTGYPVEDLALRESFVDASEHRLRTLALTLRRRGLGEVAVVLGHLARAPRTDGVDGGRPIAHNASSVLLGGKVVTTYAKQHLPNYGVFDEHRYFVPGDGPCVLRVRPGEDEPVDVVLAVCEDLWQDGGPASTAREHDAGLLLVVNASPFELDKSDARLELVQRRAREGGCAVAYVNMAGGQDELVFDGDSLVVDADGQLLARAPQFAEHTLLLDLPLPAATAPAGPNHVDVDVDPVSDDAPPALPNVEEPGSDEEAVWSALVTGLRAYVEKNGFRSVLLGLSGGIDSAVVAALACDALGPMAVYGVAMPARYSTEHSLADAEELADRTGLGYAVVPVEPMVETFVDGLGLPGVAEENAQARVRGTTLMALANSDGHLVLATGNKSELAVGYSTIYGDAVGGFAPLKDVPKTWVWRLARWRNAVAEMTGEIPPIPTSSIEKPPSAELRPDQVDQNSLPPYDVLDAVLEGYVGQDRSAAQLVEAGFDPDVVQQVVRLVDRAEWKRRQYPMGTKISFRAFGRDRRQPVTSRWAEVAPGATPTEEAAAAPDPADVPTLEDGTPDPEALHDLMHDLAQQEKQTQDSGPEQPRPAE